MIRLSTFAIAVLATALISAPIAAQPTPPTPPTPGTPPTARAPKPPKPPRPPRPPRDGRVHLPDHLRAEAQAEIERARADIDRALAEIDQQQQIPPHLRAKLRAQLSKLRDADLDSLIDMSGDMAEFEAEMKEFEKEMEKWGEAYGEQMARQYGVFGGDPDDALDRDTDDTDPDDVSDRDPWGSPPMPPPPPRMGRMPRQPLPPVLDLDDDLQFDFDFDFDFDPDRVKLTAGQRAELKRIASAEKAAIRPARQRLEELSRELRGELADTDTDEAEVNRLVDEISDLEGTMRKARLGALTRTRKVLSAAQRAQVDPRAP